MRFQDERINLDSLLAYPSSMFQPRCMSQHVDILTGEDFPVLKNILAQENDSSSIECFLLGLRDREEKKRRSSNWVSSDKTPKVGIIR